MSDNVTNLRLEKLKNAITLLEGQNIDEMKQALTLVGEPVAETVAQSNVFPFKVGEQYFVRTVTYFQVGRLTEIVGNFLVFEDASWIADTGRFTDAIKSGNFNEVEPVGVAIVNTAGIIDAFPFTASLPKEQK